MAAALKALHKVVLRKDLNESEAIEVMKEILAGDVGTTLTGALLVALQMKGETVDEIVGFARAMRAAATRIEIPSIDSSSLVDTCGTGGDGLHSFNISTVTAFVVAGAGVRVAKHGNRSISSRCGSADVLETVGVNVRLKPAQVAASIENVGIGFLFAPMIHPAMKHAQPVRTELKMRTVFNVLGPLTNPLAAGAQVVGVFERALVPIVGEALRNLNVDHAFVVHGSDGLDEVTTTGPTTMAEISHGRVLTKEIQPADFGLQKSDNHNFVGGDAEENADILRQILSGQLGPKRDVVLANAATALVAAGSASNFLVGVKLAAQSIDSGKAAQKLKALVDFTGQF